jgi:AcrR family transcriptional regulator
MIAIKQKNVAGTERTTRDILVEAAGREFNDVGYHGTNTNKIAKIGGFAPQTFYRHFEDKIDIFLAAYDAWQASERHAVARATKSGVSEVAVAKAILQHHVQWRVFRSSLRLLAVEEPRVRTARAVSRERQLEALVRLSGKNIDRAEAAAALFTIERLCDAVADGEFDDLDIDTRDVLPRIVDALKRARGASSSSAVSQTVRNRRKETS